ncbi:MAG: CBS domain-containing protein [Oligoflexia bacterium]|nr:CBS domain-containing protein [Oligoflexia bacterium]
MKKIRDIMTSQVDVIEPSCTLKDAAKRMRDLNVGAVPVGENDRLKGMVTDRDIAINAIAVGKDPNKTTVSEVMTGPIVYCFDDQDIEDAARLMETKLIRRLAVLNRSKRFVGVVSLGDLACKGGNEALAGEALEKISSSQAKAIAA